MELMYMPFENGLAIYVVSNILTIKSHENKEVFIHTSCSAWREEDYLELVNLMPKLNTPLIKLARDYLAMVPSHHVIDVLHQVVDGHIFDTHCHDMKALAQWLVYHTDAFGSMLHPFIRDSIDIGKLCATLEEESRVYSEDTWWDGEYFQGPHGVIGVIQDT